MNRLITAVSGLALIVAGATSAPAFAEAAASATASTGTLAAESPIVRARAHKQAKPTPSHPIKPVLSGVAHDVTLPAGTVLPVALETSVGSDISRVEQPVTGRLRRALVVGGAEVLPAGTVVSGHVTTAQRPGKVKGRGLIAMRFTKLDTPGAGSTAISTATVSRMAPATKQKDALEILAPAAAGAVIGRIAGGKSGAAKGAVIGGGAGTGVVLATRGQDVRLGKGASLAVRLTAPVTFHVAGR